jgi:hypothetical protein
MERGCSRANSAVLAWGLFSESYARKCRRRFGVLLLLATGQAVVGFSQSSLRPDSTQSPSPQNGLIAAADSAPLRGDRQFEWSPATRTRGVEFVLPARSVTELAACSSFGLSLSGVRRGTSTLALGAGDLCRGEGVFAYIHASIVEAFVDLDEGLEQVFTIPEPLLCQASLRNVEPLELQLEWSGDLCAARRP